MDNPLLRPSAQRLQKPQVFMKVEFGVSWSAQHRPRKHGIEFTSRALRDRNPDFPRHVPAPTTNYLAATSIQQHQPDQRPQFHFHGPPQEYGYSAHLSERDSQPRNPNTVYLNPEPYQDERGRSRHIEAIPEPPPLGFMPTQDRRAPRVDSSASIDRHERGSSAPPPLSDNHWDVVQETTAHGSSTACAATQPGRPVSNSDMMKELPEIPTRFRLGEDGMPWEGTWTFPMGFEPFLEPDPYLRPASSHASLKPQYDDGQERPQSPHQRSSPGDVRSPTTSPPSDPARRRELEALGSAMMTVDNGFENQWWNSDDRGERQALAPAPAAGAGAAMEPVHPPPATSEQIREQMALGWVGALLPPNSSVDGNGKRFSVDSDDHGMSPGGSPGRRSSHVVGNTVVSPVSSYSGPLGGLSRSLSTRSEELWFTGGRYA